MEEIAFHLIRYEIESQIVLCARRARRAGVELNDWHIRATLGKVWHGSRISRESARDQILARLHDDLWELKKAPVIRRPDGSPALVPLIEWHRLFVAVEKTIQLHWKGASARGYLDFIENAMPGCADGSS
jgi:hypothetical protein